MSLVAYNVVPAPLIAVPTPLIAVSFAQNPVPDGVIVAHGDSPVAHHARGVEPRHLAVVAADLVQALRELEAGELAQRHRAWRSLPKAIT